jgi:hypothetical protein
MGDSEVLEPIRKSAGLMPAVNCRRRFPAQDACRIPDRHHGCRERQFVYRKTSGRLVVKKSVAYGFGNNAARQIQMQFSRVFAVLPAHGRILCRISLIQAMFVFIKQA